MAMWKFRACNGVETKIRCRRMIQVTLSDASRRWLACGGGEYREGDFVQIVIAGGDDLAAVVR